MVELVDKDIKTVIITTPYSQEATVNIEHIKQRYGRYKKDSN